MAKKGLYYNINKRKEAGTSRSKANSTISPEAYKNMQEGFPNSKKNRGAYLKKKKFKPHTMYDKNGKPYKANTMQEHLDMKKKGYGHKKKKGAYMKKADAGYKMGKKKKSFPDLNKDGKITKADVLVGRGVAPAQGRRPQRNVRSEMPYNTSKRKKLIDGSGKEGLYRKKKGAYMQAMKNKIGMKAGKVVRKTLTNTRPVKSKMDMKDGLYRNRAILSVSADQVGGGSGVRYYSGEGSSQLPNLARQKAPFRARMKMATAPQDSIPASQIPMMFEDAPKKKKRKGLFRRRSK